MRRAALAASLALLIAVGVSRADNVPLDFSASITGTSNYIFRGFSLAPAGVILDASLTGHFTDEWSATAYVWNYDKIDGGVRFGEADYDLSVRYAPESLPLSFTAGYVYYDAANFIRLNTQEAYFGVDVDWHWNPSLRVYYDFDTFVGTYANLGVSNSWELKPDVILDLGASLGLDFGRAVDTFNDFKAGGAVTWQFLPEWNVYGGADVWVPSHQVGLYGARVVPYAGVGYSRSW